MGILQKGSKFLGISDPVFALIICVVLALLIVGVTILIIGLFGFIGIVLLLMSGYLFLSEKGKIKLAVTPFWILFGVGLFFLLASHFGLLQVFQIDLSIIPGMSELNSWAGNL